MMTTTATTTTAIKPDGGLKPRRGALLFIPNVTEVSFSALAVCDINREIKMFGAYVAHKYKSFVAIRSVSD